MNASRLAPCDEEKPLPLPSSPSTTNRAISGDEKTATATNSAVGAYIAWLHCLSAFLLFFNGWGIINSFGTLS